MAGPSDDRTGEVAQFRFLAWPRVSAPEPQSVTRSATQRKLPRKSQNNPENGGSRRVHIGNTVISVTLSVGGAASPADGGTVDTLEEAVDRALCAANRAGDKKVRSANPLFQKA